MGAAMHEAIFGGLAGVLLVAWLLSEMRCGTRTRIAIGLGCVTSLAGAWFVAQSRIVRRETAHEMWDQERLHCIRSCADFGDIQKVQRLASMPSHSFSEGGGIRIWEEENEIARQVRELGGSGMPCGALNPLACVYVDLSRRAVTEAALRQLGRLPRIGNVVLAGSSITDNGLEHISNLTQLQRLRLDGTAITDVGLQHLKGMTQLEYLNLRGTRVSDAGLDQISRLGRLEDLNLTNTGVTEEGVKRLREALPKCRIHR